MTILFVRTARTARKIDTILYLHYVLLSIGWVELSDVLLRLLHVFVV